MYRMAVIDGNSRKASVSVDVALFRLASISGVEHSSTEKKWRVSGAKVAEFCNAYSSLWIPGQGLGAGQSEGQTKGQTFTPGIRVWVRLHTCGPGCRSELS